MANILRSLDTSLSGGLADGSEFELVHGHVDFESLWMFQKLHSIIIMCRTIPILRSSPRCDFLKVLRHFPIFLLWRRSPLRAHILMLGEKEIVLRKLLRMVGKNKVFRLLVMLPWRHQMCPVMHMLGWVLWVCDILRPIIVSCASS